ncbi:MAG: leucine-rich repeat domain-containing protein [Clostridia bacterium]|nr:leucine-rich repeat domain-containing protein [Clostridia bacterium]
MKKGKKIIALSLSALISLGLFASCGEDDKPDHVCDLKNYVVKEATCKEYGEIESVCQICGKKTTLKAEKTSNHNYEWTVVESTSCKVLDKMVGTCTICGGSAQTNLDSAGPHDFGWELIESTNCLTPNTNKGTCIHCGVEATEDADSFGPHKFVWAVQDKPTCTQSGILFGLCEFCPATTTRIVEKLPHNFVGGECTSCGGFEKIVDVEENVDVGYSIDKITNLLKKFIPDIENNNDALSILSSTDIYSLYANGNDLYVEFGDENWPSFYADDFFNSISTITSSAKHYSVNLGALKSDFVLEGGFTKTILTINVKKFDDEYKLEIILSDGTKKDVGYFFTENCTANDDTIIKAVAVNKQNEFLVFFNNNTAIKCGTLSENKLFTDNSLLIYEKLPNQNAYAVCGVYDKTLTEIVIPATHKGLPVTSISRLAFYNTSITSVVIGENVQTIEECAFSQCKKLQSVYFSDSVKTIGEYAFYNNLSLSTVTLGKSVETIKEGAFYQCENLYKISFPSTLKQVEAYAFYLTNSLTVIESKVERESVTIDVGNHKLKLLDWTYVD